MRTVLFLLIVWPTAVWLLFVPFRAVKRGWFKYRLSTIKRSQHPLWFWCYAVAAGLCGAVLMIASLYVLEGRA